MGFGRLYRAIRQATERLRIAWFEGDEALDRQRIALEILRLRRGALLAFVFVAATALALDLQFASWLEDAQLPGYLEDRLHLPAADGLRDFASALAVAVATATAMLLSISLVVLGNAGERYGGRLVRYLLAERVSRYVLDLLLLTLLYSIWTIAVLLVVDATPFCSLLVLSGLVLLAILSLPVYRQHVLAMLAPRASIEVLGNDVRRMLRRIPLREKRGSRSVANWLRANTAARLRDLESLIDAILGPTKKDAESAEQLALELIGLLGPYAWMKHRIPSDSGWYPSRHEPIPEVNRYAFIERRRMLDALGLGRPTQEVPDEDWLEREIFEMLQGLVDRSLVAGDRQVAPRVLAQLEVAIEHLLHLQSERAFKESLSLVQHIAACAPKGSDTGRQAINCAVSMGRLAIKGSDWSSWLDRGMSMLKGVPRERDVWNWRPPAATERVLLQARSKLELEETLMGAIVTPQAWFQPELEEALTNIHVDLETRAMEAAVCCLSETVVREGLGSEVGVAAVYGTFLLWHQCLLEERPELERLLPGERVKWGRSAPVEQQKRDAEGIEWEGPLMDEIASCCMLLLLEGPRFKEHKELVDPLVVRVLMPFGSREEWLDGMHRLQAVAGLAFLVSEVRRDHSLCEAVMARVLHFIEGDSARWAFFEERWELTLDPSLAFMFGLHDSLTVKYHSYFVRAWEEIKDIGEAPVPGAVPATLVDHPSSFLRGHVIYGTVNPEDCAKEFLERLRKRQGGSGTGEDTGESREDTAEDSSSGEPD